MYKKIFSMIFVSLYLIMMFSSHAFANLEDEMRDMFNTMLNISDGGYFKGMGRGVVAGPSLVVRNPNVNMQLINFRPPSVSAGCGGIDMFLGSFSFINEEQFIQLLQAIAANAAGYAFKIALSTMCPTCNEVITGLQKTMAALNALAGDSCRSAKAIVDTAADKMGLNEMKQAASDTAFARACSTLGRKLDDFASHLNNLGTESNTCKLTEEEIKALMGNVAWKILRKNNFLSGFSNGDTELARVFMSLTGTIIGTKSNPSDPESCPDNPYIIEKDALLDLNQMIDGADENNKVKIYTCEDGEGEDQCTQMGTQEYIFKGLKSFVLDVLVGTDHSNVANDSLIYKLAHNTGSLTEDERNLVRLAPTHLTRLRNIAVCAGLGGYSVMIKYATSGAKLIATDMVLRYINEVKKALNNNALTQTVDIGGHYFTNFLAPRFKDNIDKLSDQIIEIKNNETNTETELNTLYYNAVVNCRLKGLNLN